MRSIALLPLAAAEHALHQFDALLGRHGAVLQQFEDGRCNVRSSAKDLLDGPDVGQRGRHRFLNQVLGDARLRVRDLVLDCAVY